MRRSVGLLLVLAMAATGCARDRYATSYPDQVAAERRDAVDRGWIPAFLPEDTTDLREVHDPTAGTHVMVATLAGGVIPDACSAASGNIEPPPLDAAWLADDASQVGTAVRCENGWVGTVEDATITLWAVAPTIPEEED